MTNLPINQKLATGTYTAGVTLTSAQNNPFTFLGKINAFPPGLGYQGGNPGLVLVAADISTLAAVPWSVTNQGSIVGSRFGVTFADDGTLSNTGVVNGQYGNGVAFAQYGKLVNSGTVKGQYAAFFPNGGIITNTATIAGDQSGIRSAGVLNINNAAGAFITAVNNVVSSYGGVSIVNASTIKATG